MRCFTGSYHQPPIRDWQSDRHTIIMVDGYISPGIFVIFLKGNSFVISCFTVSLREETLPQIGYSQFGVVFFCMLSARHTG